MENNKIQIDIKKMNVENKNFEDVKIDSKDLYIIQELVENSRITNKDLSIKVNLSRNTIDTRIKKLKSSGVIGLSRLITNVYSLGFSQFILFIEKPELYFDNSKLYKLINNKYILEIVMLYGKHNCYIRFAAKNLEQKEFFVSEILSLISPKSYELVESTHFDLNPSKRNYDSKVIIPNNYQIPSKSNKIYELDNIDKNILTNLSADPDINYAILGRKLNYSTQLIISRVKKLLSRKIILFFNGRCTLKNSNKTFYFLRFENRDYSRNEELFKYLLFSKFINHVDILSNSKNFFCIITTNTQTELEKFIQDLLIKFDKMESLTIDLYIGNISSNFHSKILFE
jgi:Lrp/AsnC family leucine-responsive transcriptional regulator